MIITNRNRLSWVVGLLAISAFVGACEQPGEALTERKRRENEAEIDQYIKQNNLSATLTAEGVYFIPTKTNATGQTPLTGDEVRYHYVTRRLDGVIVDSSDIAGNNPATVTLAGTNTVGITLGRYAGILKLKQGEEGAVLVPAALDGGRVGTLLLPQYSPVRYDLRIVSVRTEDQQIEDYIRTNKITVATKTTEGIRVVKTLTQPTDSAAIVTGKKVTLNYLGKRLDGTIFENYSATTRQIQIGTKQVVPGLENGLPNLRSGEKATLIFPSTLGYGTTGSYNNSTRTYTVLPYSPLIYEVTIIKVE